jgi:hypothetical protein
MAPAVLKISQILPLLLLLYLAQTALTQTHTNINSKRPRHLLSQPGCPAWCHPDFCFVDGTGGGLRCAKCLNNLVFEILTVYGVLW